MKRRVGGARAHALVVLGTVGLCAGLVALGNWIADTVRAWTDDAGERREIAALTVELHSLKAKLAGAGAAPFPGAGLAPVLPQPQVRAVAAHAVADPHQSTEDPSPQAIVAEIDEQFYQEPERAPWGQSAAPRASAVLRRLLTAGSTLGKVDCRQTLCRIESSHQNLDDFHKFITGVIATERSDDSLWNAGVNSQVTEQSSGSVKTVTFLSREGAPVPGAQPGADETPL